MSDELIFTGKSVDEAIAEGLRTLRLTQEDVEIEVISRGSRGIFGLGSEPAQVRMMRRQIDKPVTPPPPVVPEPAKPVAQAVTKDEGTAMPAEQASVADHQARAEPARQEQPVDEPVETPPRYRSKPALEGDAESETEDKTSPEDDEQLAQLATELLGDLVRLMGFDADVVAEWREPDADNEQRYLLLDLQGKDLSPLIGRRGETLSNMQYLVRLMVNQRLHRWKNIVVDVEGYRQRRIDHLSQLALRSAQQVAQTGRPLSLEPMAPGERRIIHLTLRDNPHVFTESSGDGERRKVQILPRR